MYASVGAKIPCAGNVVTYLAFDQYAIVYHSLYLSVQFLGIDPSLPPT